jgi:hypothetical protein
MRRLRNRSARAVEGDNTSTARSSDEMSRHVFGQRPPSIGTAKRSGCTSRRGENSMSAGEMRASPSPFDSVYGLRWSYSLITAYPRLGEGGKRTYAEDKVGKLNIPRRGGPHRADSTRLRSRDRLVGSRTEHHAQKKSVHEEAAHGSHGVADQYRLTHTRMGGELR